MSFLLFQVIGPAFYDCFSCYAKSFLLNFFSANIFNYELKFLQSYVEHKSILINTMLLRPVACGCFFFSFFLLFLFWSSNNPKCNKLLKFLDYDHKIAAIKTLDSPRDEKNPVFNMSSYKFEESRDIRPNKLNR